MDARELLVDTHPHLPPAATLAGITPADATRLVAGLPHSIAEVVAHMHFWQAWFTARCTGIATPMAATAAHGWPDVGDGDWPTVCDRFVAGLEALAAAVGNSTPTSRFGRPSSSRCRRTSTVDGSRCLHSKKQEGPGGSHHRALGVSCEP